MGRVSGEHTVRRLGCLSRVLKYPQHKGPDPSQYSELGPREPRVTSRCVVEALYVSKRTGRGACNFGRPLSQPCPESLRQAGTPCAAPTRGHNGNELNARSSTPLQPWVSTSRQPSILFLSASYTPTWLPGCSQQGTTALPPAKTADSASALAPRRAHRESVSRGPRCAHRPSGKQSMAVRCGGAREAPPRCSW